MMPRLFRFFAALAFLSALLGCSAGPSVALLGEPPRPLDAFRGQWLFVNYWAEWCGPCLEEIPELNAFHGEANGAQVLGINFDQVGPEVMAQQASQLAITFPLALGDPGTLLGVSAPEVLPSTYVIDPKGTLRTVLVGPQDAASLAAAMANP
ncbi:MAG: TlpA family protein disulfide reductase [Pseudomonadales bacterium]|jgi:thiol-disulfide isomerase/thioredoxin|nr:TlpA family protein disulfide reductase [Pseudomonadales bacterium]MBL6808898.1 TlpA family protein disulfide reductase [Pseudomonadales bacterium]MDA0955619.1 TlpA disulfide reductase family protein [Pseudomonadota bacterium]